ncbi:hypothetical protein GCM10022247_36230 [Allokutzneria multivorans]|uniref:SWIM-type domain-containing protein n=1 Tax=Allokutzneria multivorans TaxID=1142134 RepID=A0ABP7SEL5_9PSEU
MTRADLLALTPEALAALANRGLVKRAAKELDTGVTPALTVADDGTVLGGFPDGARVTLTIHSGLEASSCSCSAPGVCRHSIGVVLAYQRQFESAPKFTPWSPGDLDDDLLTEHFGARTLAAARRLHRCGYPARVRRPTATDPVASVELPSCTVRFLVPGEIGLAHTDATAAKRDELIALAVWAFRAADERGLGDDAQLDVGGVADTHTHTTDMDLVTELVHDLVLDGAMHASSVLDAALARAAHDLRARALHWPAAAVEDLLDQLGAYRSRSARYRPEHFADLLTELHARRLAVTNGGASPRSRVLGTDEAAETALRRVRLTSLGCRIGGTTDERTAEVFLASGHSGTILVLRKRWELTEDEDLTGADLAGRRVAGSTLSALATANLVSESASRSPGRVVRIASNRVAKTTITPLGTAWEHLPDTVLVRELAALNAELADLPPRLVRPRVAAELLRVVQVCEVRSISYSPGDQRVDAVIADAHGTTARVSARHRSACPAALDALVEALSSGPRLISAVLRRSGGGLVLDPLAVMTDDGVIVPDLATRPATPLRSAEQRRPDPLTDALDTALTACAELAHRGLRHAPPGLRTRIERAAAGLRRVGLHIAAGQLADLSASLGRDDPAPFLTAYLRLTTTAERR